MATDRRTKYTKSVIRQALFELLQDKPIAKITVTDICKLADINRSTFYAHYADPFVLYEELQAKTVEELSHSLDHLAGENAFRTYMVYMVRYVQEHQAAFLALVNNDSRSFQEALNQAVQRFHLPGLEQFGSRQPYVLEYFYSGTVAVLSYWLRRGAQESPQDMADLLLRLMAS